MTFAFHIIRQQDASLRKLYLGSVGDLNLIAAAESHEVLTTTARMPGGVHIRREPSEPDISGAPQNVRSCGGSIEHERNGLQMCFPVRVAVQPHDLHGLRLMLPIRALRLLSRRNGPSTNPNDSGNPHGRF